MIALKININRCHLFIYTGWCTLKLNIEEKQITKTVSGSLKTPSKFFTQGIFEPELLYPATKSCSVLVHLLGSWGVFFFTLHLAQCSAEELPRNHALIQRKVHNTSWVTVHPLYARHRPLFCKIWATPLHNAMLPFLRERTMPHNCVLLTTERKINKGTVEILCSAHRDK